MRMLLAGGGVNDLDVAERVNCGVLVLLVLGSILFVKVVEGGTVEVVATRSHAGHIVRVVAGRCM